MGVIKLKAADPSAIHCPNCAVNERRMAVINRLNSFLKLSHQYAPQQGDPHLIELAQQITIYLGSVACQESESLPDVERNLRVAERYVVAGAEEITRVIKSTVKDVIPQ